MALTRPSLYIAATFLAAAAYEVAVALRWIAMPLEPGADPTGQGVVLVAVLAAIAATLVVAWFRPRDGFFASIPLAAAAWLVAHYYAFDAYYLPSHRRFSDSGSVSPYWVYGVALAGGAVALASRRTSVPAAVYVVVCALTVVGMGVGH
jgi:hypothetical protein